MRQSLTLCLRVPYDIVQTNKKGECDICVALDLDVDVVVDVIVVVLAAAVLAADAATIAAAIITAAIIAVVVETADVDAAITAGSRV